MCALCKEHVGDADSSINSEAMEVSSLASAGSNLAVEVMSK